jgi:hypothetical protein
VIKLASIFYKEAYSFSDLYLNGVRSETHIVAHLHYNGSADFGRLTGPTHSMRAMLDGSRVIAFMMAMFTRGQY